MDKNYVIINIMSNGCFNKDDDKQIIFIEAMKVDKNLNKLDDFRVNIKSKESIMDDEFCVSDEKIAMMDFMKFCEDSNIITYNAEFELSFILKALYKNKIINNFRFKYIDIRDVFRLKEDVIGELTLYNVKKYYDIFDENDVISIFNIIRIYLKDNCIDDLRNLFLRQQFHGKIFRGLNYPKYLCDVLIGKNKYYGYVVDFSSDKYVSYCSFLKEINKEYFSLDEIRELKDNGGKVIMNVSYLCDETVTFTDCYSIQVASSTRVDSNCYKLINGINNFLKYNKNDKRLKLVLWGTIEDLREKYAIIDKNVLQQFSLLIDIIKEPWDYWNDRDLKILDK